MQEINVRPHASSMLFCSPARHCDWWVIFYWQSSYGLESFLRWLNTLCCSLRRELLGGQNTANDFFSLPVQPTPASSTSDAIDTKTESVSDSVPPRLQFNFHWLHEFSLLCYKEGLNLVLIWVSELPTTGHVCFCLATGWHPIYGVHNLVLQATWYK